jgi:hypothetical protein
MCIAYLVACASSARMSKKRSRPALRSLIICASYSLCSSRASTAYGTTPAGRSVEAIGGD